MSVRTWGRCLEGLLLASFCIACSDQHVSQPNVLLYVSDTLRADSLACYGNTVVQTPHIDELAGEGVLFENALAPSSWTRASMGSILSGTMPAVHGAEGRYDLLEDSVVLISELLRGHGYSTANITTNRNVGAFFGFDQGFDDGGFIELYSPSQENMVYVRELVTRADEATRAAIEWLEGAAEPFCLIVHTIDPHSPYAPLAEWDRYGRGIRSEVTGTHDSLFALGKQRTAADVEKIRSLYYGEIAFNDESFGTLVKWMKTRGLYDRTITVFTSDHGEEFWELGERGHGKTVNEKSLHVPLILRYPPKLISQRLSGLVSTVDIVPTLLSLADLDIPEYIEGAALTGATRTEVFSSCFLGNRELISLRNQRWKLVTNLKQNTSALYDMKADSGEQRDVARRHKNIVRELSTKLRESVDHQREQRLRLHGSGKAPTVEDLPAEIDEGLRAMGYAGEEASIPSQD